MKKATNWDRYFAAQMEDGDIREMVEEELKALRVGAELARLRQKAGLTQEQLAERCRMKVPNLSRIENDPSPNLTLSTICKMAGAMGREMVVSFRPAVRRFAVAKKAYRTAGGGRVHKRRPAKRTR